ncbi:MAG TPA: succinate dehydrogenase iron-sulfur subunit [Candidatus Binataceae bacterium]|nr:succinate dehydrogenase iron-sulfur subunit [Candidatus Binataceae bacterium]
MAERTQILRIKRQDGPDKQPYWQEFELPYKPYHNIVSMLMEIRRNPITRDGKSVAPVVFDANCLEEVCGSCTMVIDGRVRQACSRLAEGLGPTVTVEPMSKFPVVRDLWVDRSRMFDYLKKVHSWIPIDGTYDLGAGPRMAPETQQFGYLFSRCMTCGCCLEACPQVNAKSNFMGAAVMGQVYLMSQHPTGKMNQDERLEAVMGDGGIADCGNAQNCVEVCPKEIPLTTAIASVGRQTSLKWLRDLFMK